MAINTLITNSNKESHLLPLINDTTNTIYYEVRFDSILNNDISLYDNYKISNKNVEIDNVGSYYSIPYNYIIPPAIKFNIDDIDFIYDSSNNLIEYKLILNGDFSQNKYLLETDTIKIINKDDSSLYYIMKKSNVFTTNNITYINIKISSELNTNDLNNNDYYISWGETTIYVEINHDIPNNYNYLKTRISAVPKKIINNNFSNTIIGEYKIFDIIYIKKNYDADRDLPIYDNISYKDEDDISFGILRTNPKLTGNIKIVINSDQSIITLQSITNKNIKPYRINKKSYYPQDLQTFTKNINSKDLYEYKNDFINNKLYSNQYQTTYNYSCFYNNSTVNKEQFSYFAPLYLNKILPKYFIIFKYNSPLNVNKDEILDKWIIHKIFDLSIDSNIGSYINSYITSKNFPNQPISTKILNKEYYTVNWNGINYNTGTFQTKTKNIHEIINNDITIIDFEELITNGFENNNLIYTDILNLEYLFDDNSSVDYSINKYFGFYCDDIDIATLKINSITSSNNQFLNINHNDFNNKILNEFDYIKNDDGIKINIDKIDGILPLNSHIKDFSKKIILKDSNLNFDDIKGINNNELQLKKTTSSLKNFSKYKEVNNINFNGNLIDNNRGGLLLSIKNNIKFNNGDFFIIKSKNNINNQEYRVIYNSEISDDYIPIPSLYNGYNKTLKTDSIKIEYNKNNLYLEIYINNDLSFINYDQISIINKTLNHKSLLLNYEIEYDYNNNRYIIFGLIKNADKNYLNSHNYEIEIIHGNYYYNFFKINNSSSTNSSNNITGNLNDITSELNKCFSFFDNSTFKCKKINNDIIFLNNNSENNISIRLFDNISFNSIYINNTLCNGNILKNITNNKSFLSTSTSIDFIPDNKKSMQCLHIKTNTNLLNKDYYVKNNLNFSKIKTFTIEDEDIFKIPYFENIFNSSVIDNTCILYLDNENNNNIQIYNNIIKFYEESIYKISILSFYPIKDFDFDFYSKEYSFSNIEEMKYFYFSKKDGDELDKYSKYLFYYDIMNTKFTEYPITIENKKLNSNGEWVWVENIPMTNNCKLLKNDENTLQIVKNIHDSINIYENSIINNNNILLSNKTILSNEQKEQIYIKINDDKNQISILNNELNKILFNNNYTDGLYYKIDISTYDETLYQITQNFDDIKIRIKVNLKEKDGSNSLKYHIIPSYIEEDIDLKLFNGFKSLNKIISFEDIDIINKIKKNNDPSIYTKYNIESEYDRLIENYNKNYSTKSRTNPYINKWVRKYSTDVYDNPYRLDVSEVFGTNGLTPLFSDSPSTYSNEWYYIDSIPSFLINNIENNRSYLFKKINKDNLNSITYDYFSEYFNSGYPSEILNEKIINIQSSQKYTKIKYNTDTGLYETLFKGILLSFNNRESTNFDDYKFTSVLSFKDYDWFVENKKYIKYNVIRNDKFKFITLYIEVYIKDYKMINYNGGYLNLYTANFQNRIELNNNINTSKLLKFGNYHTSSSFVSNKSDIMKYEYYNDTVSKKTILPSINTINNNPISYIESNSINIEDINTTRVINNIRLLKKIDNQNILPKDIFKFNKFNIRLSGYGDSIDISSTSILDYKIFNTNENIILLSDINSTFGVYSNPITNNIIINTAINPYSNLISKFKAENTILVDCNLNVNENIKIKTGIEYIINLFNTNENSTEIEWINISKEGFIKKERDMSIKFISQSEILKSYKKIPYFENDNPEKFSNSSNIISNINTIQQIKSIFRYYGNFIPKFNDVIFSNKRESSEFSNYYQKSFTNSRISLNYTNPKFGIIDNYFYNKISDYDIVDNNITFISSINYTNIDRKRYDIFSSNWGNNFFQNYKNYNSKIDVNGTNDLECKKYFFSSSLCKLPSIIDINNYSITNTNDNSFSIYKENNNFILNLKSAFVDKLAQIFIDNFNDYKSNDSNIFKDKNIKDYAIEYIHKNIYTKYSSPLIEIYFKENTTTSFINTNKNNLIDDGFIQIKDIDISINKEIVNITPNRVGYYYIILYFEKINSTINE